MVMFCLGTLGRAVDCSIMLTAYWSLQSTLTQVCGLPKSAVCLLVTSCLAGLSLGFRVHY